MTLEELAGMLEEIGFPFAYDHFAEGESPDTPFICYLLPGAKPAACRHSQLLQHHDSWSTPLSSNFIISQKYS